MTVIELELPDEQAARLQSQARERGLTVGQWVIALSGQIAGPVDQAEDRPIWEILAESFRDIPAEERILLPRDGASQADHYVYGLPKRDQ